MGAHYGDAGVFIRSMATRGHLGGLARATSDVALVLDAAGKDVVMIETVGVGQDEVDIVRTADISIVVLVPGTGDEVQALKAGIMEIADIFVVNKADRDGADRLVQSVSAMLSLQTFQPGDWRPPIQKTEATTGTGIAELLDDDPAVPRTLRRRASLAAARTAGIPPARSAFAPIHAARRGDASCRRAAAHRGRHRRARGRSLFGGGRDHAPRRCPDGGLDRRRAWTQLAPAHRIVKAILDHVGIAVQDLDKALAFYRDALGLEVEAPEEVYSQRVRAHFLPVGQSSIELLEATASDSAIAKYVEKRGPGIHHITLRVPTSAPRSRS